MIDLATDYLGLKLRNPLVCAPSPLCQDLDALLRMEENGAAAVVLHSLFEEQIERNSPDPARFLNRKTAAEVEALSYAPDMVEYNLGPEGYLEHIREAKALLKMPVIASLNAHTRGGWVRYARLIEEAGADAVELNVYEVPTDPHRSSGQVEQELVELVHDVRSAVHIPVAVKLSPFYTAPAALAARLEAAGARGLVLFNRFYQPDFDLERMEIVPSLWLSTAEELRLRLHWAAILSGRVGCDLALTGGVHTAQDVLKTILAGATVAMLASALLRHGVEHLAEVLAGICDWMAMHEQRSFKMLRGKMSFRALANPSAFERANYMKVLQAHGQYPTG